MDVTILKEILRSDAKVGVIDLIQKRHIFLIGFMGTGKSTLGAELARIAKLPFIDLDAEIERVEGISIAEIFELHGENYFRDVETERLRQIIAEHHHPIVIATGGGVVLRAVNRQLMLERGWVVRTNAAKSEILRRLQRDRHLRPLLAGNLEERIDRLLLERESLYDFSDLTIQTDEMDLGEAVQKVLSILTIWDTKGELE